MSMFGNAQLDIDRREQAGDLHAYHPKYDLIGYRHRSLYLPYGHIKVDDHDGSHSQIINTRSGLTTSSGDRPNDDWTNTSIGDDVS
jgi:hypothetical protein